MAVAVAVAVAVACVDAEVDATSEEEAWFVDRLVVVAGQEGCR